ncbi:hypothetical protein [Flexivirga aerilata]|uniref:hypothetical protein n=1 Tax=Flexivirga aerilata TaxID=1656889 RepID=UPI001BB279AF|nr:hypothetical protein [Flexivirga aerilata]
MVDLSAAGVAGAALQRILISNDFYPALTRPNVDLVTAPIERLTPRGIITADGEHHPADVVVLATGFRATDFLTPMAVTGAGGRSLDDAWADGAEAHLGITVAGFPNLCLLYGPNTNLGHSSIVFMLEAQFRYALALLEGMRRDGARAFDVRAEALRASSEQMQRWSRHTVWDRGCTSWYRTASGRHTNNWPGMTVDYWRRTRRVDWADFALATADRRSDVVA